MAQGARVLSKVFEGMYNKINPSGEFMQPHESKPRNSKLILVLSPAFSDLGVRVHIQIEGMRSDSDAKCAPPQRTFTSVTKA